MLELLLLKLNYLCTGFPGIFLAFYKGVIPCASGNTCYLLPEEINARLYK